MSHKNDFNGRHGRQAFYVLGVPSHFVCGVLVKWYLTREKKYHIYPVIYLSVFQRSPLQAMHSTQINFVARKNLISALGTGPTLAKDGKMTRQLQGWIPLGEACFFGMPY